MFLGPEHIINEEIFNLFSCSVDEIKNSTDSFFLAGTAISVGCFDGPHAGHKFLFSSVLVSFYAYLAKTTQNNTKGEFSCSLT